MLHPHTEVRFVDPYIGYGVFATRAIPRGTVVWVQDQLDRVFTEEDVRELEPALQQVLDRYCFRDRHGGLVLCWDNARFVNHSFFPNCILTPYGFDLAVADIPQGGQVTNDYGLFNVGETIECLPEEGSSRTCVRSDDLLHYSGHWDDQIRRAFGVFSRVEQPLIELIPRDRQVEVERIIRGEIEPASVFELYFNPASLLQTNCSNA